ncbi:MAG: peptidylprolyl isomerase [Anaerolineae bacterium]
MRLRVALVGLMVLLPLVACHNPQTGPTPLSQTPLAGGGAPSGVAARVNGQPIALAVYEAQVQAALASLQEQPGADTSPEGQAALRQQVLDWLIDQALLDQAATREGLAVSDEEVEAEVARVRGENPAGFSSWLQANGYSEEAFRAQTRSDLLGARLRERVAAQVPATAEQVHLRQIVLGSEAEAQDVAAQIRQGADWAVLARTRSLDAASRDSNGDLGFVPRGLLPDAVEQAAFSLQPGDIAGPVVSAYGWHIIHVVERDPARPVPADMLDFLRQQAFEQWLEEERGKAEIERFVS